MKCSNTTRLYYIFPVANTLCAITGIVLSIFYNNDVFALIFGAYGVISLGLCTLPNKITQLKKSANIIDNLQKQIDALEEGKKEIKKLLMQFQDENLHLKEQVKNFAFLNGELRLSLNVLFLENKKFADENQKLTITSEKLQKNVLDLETLCQKLQATAQEYEKSLSHLHQLEMALQEFHDRCERKEAKAFEGASQWLSEKLSYIQEKAEQERVHQKSQTDQLVQLRNSLELTFQNILQAMNEKHLALLMTVKRENETQVAALRHEVSELGVKRAQFTTQIDVLQASIKHLQETESRLKGTVSLLETRIHELDQQNKRFETSNDKLEHQADRLTGVSRVALATA